MKDCLPELDQMIANGDKFDFVINDLTAIPVTHSVEGRRTAVLWADVSSGH